jgi:hypothetical protein
MQGGPCQIGARPNLASRPVEATVRRRRTATNIMDKRNEEKWYEYACAAIGAGLPPDVAAERADAMAVLR